MISKNSNRLVTKSFLNEKGRAFFSTPIFRWIGKKRGEMSGTFAVIALISMFWGNAQPIDLLNPNSSNLVFLCWFLIVAGVSIRIWAAGNLQKNEEVTQTGIYKIVRHPLYLGTSLIYLAFYLAIGNYILGIVLFFSMYFIVYYPRMLHEEGTLKKNFPLPAESYITTVPRILPNPFLIRDAIISNSFSFKRAWKNKGILSLWAVIFLPIFFKVVTIIKK